MAEADNKSWDQTKALITALQRRDRIRSILNYGKVYEVASKAPGFQFTLNRDTVITASLETTFREVEGGFNKQEKPGLEKEYFEVNYYMPHLPAKTPLFDKKIEDNIKNMPAGAIKEKFTEEVKESGNKSKNELKDFEILKKVIIKHRPELKDDIEQIIEDGKKGVKGAEKTSEIEKPSTKQVESPENSIKILGIKIPDSIAKALQKAGVKAENAETSSSKSATPTPTAPGKSEGPQR